MTPHLIIKVVNCSNGKTVFERVVTGVNFCDVPFGDIVSSLDFLFSSIDHTILFDCYTVEPIKTIG